MSELGITFPDELLDAIAERVASRIAARDHRATIDTPWLTQEHAAAYLGCSTSRVKTLTVADAIPHHRDGRRPLYHRDELDAYVRGGGARCP
jgi:excisionase family DNA binding protein